MISSVISLPFIFPLSFLYRTLVVQSQTFLNDLFIFLCLHSYFPPFCCFASLSGKFLHPINLFQPIFLFTFHRTSSHQFLSLLGLRGCTLNCFFAFPTAGLRTGFLRCVTLVTMYPSAFQILKIYCYYDLSILFIFVSLCLKIPVMLIYWGLRKKPK